jgi:hypothetical protein
MTPALTPVTRVFYYLEFTRDAFISLIISLTRPDPRG